MQTLLTAAQWLDLRKIVLAASGQPQGRAIGSVQQIGEKVQLFDACIKTPKAR